MFLCFNASVQSLRIALHNIMFRPFNSPVAMQFSCLFTEVSATTNKLTVSLFIVAETSVNKQKTAWQLVN